MLIVLMAMMAKSKSAAKSELGTAKVKLAPARSGNKSSRVEPKLKQANPNAAYKSTDDGGDFEATSGGNKPKHPSTRRRFKPKKSVRCSDQSCSAEASHEQRQNAQATKPNDKTQESNAEFGARCNHQKSADILLTVSSEQPPPASPLKTLLHSLNPFRARPSSGAGGKQSSLIKRLASMCLGPSASASASTCVSLPTTPVVAGAEASTCKRRSSGDFEQCCGGRSTERADERKPRPHASANKAKQSVRFTAAVGHKSVWPHSDDTQKAQSRQVEAAVNGANNNSNASDDNAGGSHATRSPAEMLDDVKRLFGPPPEVARVAASASSSDGECPMSSGKFRAYGYRLIDYISNYLDTIDKRRVTPLNIEPGYLKELLALSAPQQGESFAQIMHDFEAYIMAGITHWQHPRFHAYFPAGNAYPSILADMLSDAIGCVGFSWAASPACTELEIIMLDWMGKMIGLPDEFLCLSSGGGDQNSHSDSNEQQQGGVSSENENNKKSKGGGVIQGSASECVLVALLAARHWAMEKLRLKYPHEADGTLLSKLTGYCSKEAHSCVEKAAMIGFINMRALDTDDDNSLRGATLKAAIEADTAVGLEPFLVSATLGTTSCCSFDNLEELGAVCRHYDIWLHCDGAYAGSALICPEFKHLARGIELATSFNMNPNKWMLINFDCSLMWVKDRFKLTRAFVVDPLYLQHSFSDQTIDYRHWGIPLSRRFRALKLWFVIRNYGVEGLQAYIRNHCKLAKLFEALIKRDMRFVVTNRVVLGLVCFRLVGSNGLNQRLLSMINASGKLHMVPASLNGRYIIRFCVCAQNACEADIKFAYNTIAELATELFESIRVGRERVRAISQQNTIDISSLALHTQQSLSVDRLNGSGSLLPCKLPPTNSTNQTTNTSQRPEAGAGRHQSRRSVRHGATLADCGSLSKTAEWAPPACLERRPISPSSEVASSERARGAGFGSAATPICATQAPGGDRIGQQRASVSLPATATTTQKSKLKKQNSTMHADVSADKPNQSATSPIAEVVGVASDDDDDLDREISIGATSKPNADDNSQEEDEDDDDEFLCSPFSDEFLCSSDGDNNNNSNNNIDSNRDARSSSKEAGRAELTSNHATSSEQQRQILLNQRNQRRHKMSLRYKRKFFVHTTSDPRVYRSSISGDINAHKNAANLSTALVAGDCKSAKVVEPATILAQMGEQSSAPLLADIDENNGTRTSNVGVVD